MLTVISEVATHKKHYKHFQISKKNQKQQKDIRRQPPEVFCENSCS